MPLETATYISDLNASNPIGATDPLSSADDHLRLLKSTIKNTFPNVAGAMTASHTQLNNLASLAATSVLANATAGAAAPAGLAASADGQVLARLAGALVFSADFPRLSQSNTFTGASQKVSIVAGSAHIEAKTTDVAGQAEFQLSNSAGAWVAYMAPANSGYRLYDGTADRFAIANGGNFDFKAGTVTSNNASASEVGYKGIPQNSQTGGYTCVLADANKHIYQNSAGVTDTIPANASVAYPIGTTLTFINAGGGAANSIAITTDTMYLAGTAFATTGTRTLTRGGIATALKISVTQWLISGTGLS